jgi:hypothetical protein
MSYKSTNPMRWDGRRKKPGNRIGAPTLKLAKKVRARRIRPSSKV